FLPLEKSWKKPLSSLTKNEGVRSLVKGDRPTYSRPWRRSFTVLPITSDRRRRDFSSSRKRSSKRTAGRIAPPCRQSDRPAADRAFFGRLGRNQGLPIP